MDVIVRPISDELAALLVEYERLNFNGQNSMTRIFTILTVGAGALGLVVSQVPGIHDKAALNAIFLSLPLAFTITFALVVEQLYAMIFEGYQARLVARRIGALTNLDGVFAFPDAQARGLYSLRHAPVKHLLSYGLIVTAIAGAYLGLTGYCVWGLVQNDVAWPVIVGAGLVYVGATALALAAFHGSQYDSRRVFQQSFDENSRATSDPILAGRITLYLLIPRLGDFVAKAAYYWIGVMGALATARITGEFHGEQFLDNLTKVILAFIVIEIGANQSKLMLNDLRDRWSDRESDRKRGRLLAQHPTGALPHVVVAAFAARLALTASAAIAMAFAWSYWVVPCAVAALTGLQIVYELFGKDRYLRRVFGAAAAYLLRTVAGFWIASLAISTTWSHAWPVGLHLAIWSTLLSMLFLGSYWRAEAEDYQRRGKKEIPRGLGKFLAADRDVTAIAVLASLSASSLVIPLWYLTDDLSWTWALALIPAILGPGFIVFDHANRARQPVGSFRSRLGKPSQNLLMGLSLMLAAAAIALTFYGGPAEPLWLCALPAVTASSALFLLAATYDDLMIEPVIIACVIIAVRFYRSAFAMNEPSREGTRKSS